MGSEDNWFGSKEVSVKQTKHMAQNYLYDEFQEFSEFWFWPFKDTCDIDLGTINVPVRIMWSNQDQLCPRDKQMRFLSHVESLDGETTVEGPHGTQSGKNDAQFFE